MVIFFLNLGKICSGLGTPWKCFLCCQPSLVQLNGFLVVVKSVEEYQNLSVTLCATWPFYAPLDRLTWCWQYSGSLLGIILFTQSSYSPGVSGNDFWTFGNGNGNGPAHSQTLGTGTGTINWIPNFWERERELKLHSQFLGTGTRMEIPFPNVGNGNETLLFPGMTGNGNGNSIAKLSELAYIFVAL